jgi:phosphatidylglycerophosphate synthase
VNWLIAIPWSLVIFRFLLGPLIVVMALRTVGPDIWLGVLFLAGPVSDIFDGVLARRLGTATPALRIADSGVDIAFYLFVLIAVCKLHWPAVRASSWLIFAVIMLEAVRLMVDLLKFGRIASYHTYTAKIWGLLLMLAVGSLLCSGRGAWLLALALAWGIVSELEGLAFSLTLEEWVHDVKSLPQALAIRRANQARKIAELSTP